MKKLLAVVLTLVVVFSFSACGGGSSGGSSGDSAPVEGKYVCTSIVMLDEEIGADDSYFELKEDGSGIYQSAGIELDASWEMDGENITIKTEMFEDTYSGTLKDGVMILDMGGSTCTYEKE